MAVTLDTNPATYQPIGNGFEFGFTLSASGDGGDLVYSIGYELYDGDDTQITELEQIPYSDQEQFADFKNEIFPLVYNTLKDPGTANGLSWDETAMLPFYVTYGQIEFDSSACTVETSGVNNDSSEYYAVASAWGWSDSYAGMASGDITVLSDRPQENYVTSDQDIFISIFRAVSDNIFVFRINYDSSGNQIGSAELNSVVSSGVHIYCASAFPEESGHEGLSRWSVYVSPNISGTPVTKQYDFIMSQCGDAPIRELHWREPKGTQSSLVFETVTIGGNQAAGSVYETRVPDSASVSDKGKNYGVSRSRIRGTEQISLSTYMHQVSGVEKWLNGLFASSKHYIKYPLSDGSYTLCKFVLQDGTWQAYSDDLLLVTVQGSIHIPINAL